MDRQPGKFATIHDLRFDALKDRPRRDERLFLAASARWEDCRQQLLELMADSPQVRSSISRNAAPAQLLEQLKGLEVRIRLSQQWDAWWTARAPGTAVSRWERATQLFRAHFDAAAQLTFAQGQADAEPLKAQQTLADSSQHDPVLAAVTRWRTHCLEAQLERLRRTREGSVAEQVATALEDADELDRQRRTQVFFTAPPGGREFASDDDEDATLLFGALDADVTLGDRRRALEQQRLAIETLLDDAHGVPDRNRLLPLQEHFDALHRAEEEANTAATALLNRSPATRMLELRQRPNAHYAALYQARLAGLRAEAAVQRAVAAPQRRRTRLARGRTG
ncbi:hypothetical protein [Pseudomonas sp. NPDC096950]|uniref:hypothetical protein n=1 Tax=Pseudomonas sp. NPDC096950 TaxID=3364485 RepID=UPI00383B9A33